MRSSLLFLLLALFALTALSRADDYYGDEEDAGSSSQNSDDYFSEESSDKKGDREDKESDEFAEWFSNDYYGALGLSSSASNAAIRKAYRALSLKFHPDRYSGDDAQARFTDIGKAYNVLKSDALRAKYDAFIASIPAQFRPRYGHVSAPLWQILVIFSIVVSAFQHVFAVKKAENVRSRAMETAAFRAAREKAEREGKPAPEVTVLGSQPPGLHELFFFQVPVFPFYLFRYIYANARWWILYDYLKRDLSDEDREWKLADEMGLSVEEYRKANEGGARVKTLKAPREVEDDHDSYYDD